MEFSGSKEDHEKRSAWMERRMKERLKKKVRCEDVYSRSRSSSPDVYRELLENYRKSKEDKNKKSKMEEDLGEDKDLSSLSAEDQSLGSEKRKHEQDINTQPKPGSESDSDEEYGPKPLKVNPALERRMKYGAELLPGEGEAIAQYIKEGKRIPRRGEVGLTSEQIENFEKIGYVMSGSRHRAINAMRIKKESMVLTAEEERQKALEKYQAKMNRENEIVNTFREMLRKKYEDEENENN